MMTSKGDPGRPEGHAHLIQSWRRLAVQLGPLVGDNGFCALFGRACRLVSPEFRWLSTMPPCKSCDAQVGALDTMLAALIGQALATRLVDAALLDGNAQEHT